MTGLFKTLATSAIAASIAAAAPLKAEAIPLIIAPAVAAVVLGGAIVGGVLVGASAAHANDAAVVPATGSVYVTDSQTPAGNCYYTRARVHGAWHGLQVCD